MFQDPQGPIEHFDWGIFIINGEKHSADGDGVGKDIFLAEGKVHAWKERKGHRLQPDMVSCVFKNEIAILVIGNGVNGAIKITKKTRKAIQEAGVQKLIIKKTPQACAVYNQLCRDGQQVALLAHGTC